MELSDPFEGELESPCGKLLELPASDFEGAFPDPEDPEAPAKYEVAVGKLFAFPTAPRGTPDFRGPEGDPASVGTA